MIKKELKKIKFLKACYHSIRKSLDAQWILYLKVITYHALRFARYSGTFHSSYIKDRAYLTWLYHVIEKGLAMPNMRLGFGHDRLLELVDMILSFENKYQRNGVVLDAVSVVLEYKRIHDENHYPLPEDIMKAISVIVKKYPGSNPLYQKEMTREDYYKELNQPFPMFAASRHSVRNFAGHISMEQIICAINIAKQCPSACNRQPARVHVVTERELIDKCLSMQSGNRGFGQLSDKLLIVTGDIRTLMGSQEFMDLGVNVGIFMMNLSYGLHYNKVAHCILNWYATPKGDKKLRRLLNISDYETIFAYIVCGDVPERFKLVMSPRLDVKEFYTVH